MIDLSIGSIKSWVKVSFFMLGLYHFIWAAYAEIGTIVVAYNYVDRLPYIYMEELK